MNAYEIIKTPVLIIGAGAAGLRVAIELAMHDIPCLVVGKRSHGDAHTTMAAGGINAALANLDPEDDWTLHAADTLREGHYLCQPRAVELLAKHSPARVLELRDWGCPFDGLDDGRLNQRYFGAQTFRRTCFAGDHTGKAILDTLVHRARELNVDYKDNIFITELLTHGQTLVGAMGWDMNRDQILLFHCRALVLAAGGLTGLYHRNSSRSGENTGDAVALAIRAGARLRDMEFVQFHPTGMVYPEELRGKLVTEAVRGEGGRLFNNEGQRFMERYAPQEMELAARDVVARAIDQEIRDGRGLEDDASPGSVRLDISHRDRAFLKERLPDLIELFDGLDIDLSKESIKVAPTAHYAMGGVRVDFETGATDIGGLFAIGEASAGLHGANRLGGNSLAETLVFGELTGAHLAKHLPSLSPGKLPHQHVEAHLARLVTLRAMNGHHPPTTLVQELGEIMEQHGGILRSEAGLNEGLDALADLQYRLDDLAIAPDDPTTIAWALNLGFMVEAAEMILRGALMRDESRGAHFRQDTPRPSETWRESIVYARDREGNLHLSAEPIEPIPAPIEAALARNLRLDYHHLE